MHFTATLIAALAILPAIGLAAWAWATMAQIEKDLRAFVGFEGVHFET